MSSTRQAHGYAYCGACGARGARGAWDPHCQTPPRVAPLALCGLWARSSDRPSWVPTRSRRRGPPHETRESRDAAASQAACSPVRRQAAGGSRIWRDQSGEWGGITRCRAFASPSAVPAQPPDTKARRACLAGAGLFTERLHLCLKSLKSGKHLIYAPRKHLTAFKGVREHIALQ